MSSITVEDDDDVAFQEDLARAIAASLEPDGSGPQDEVARGDGPGSWNALLAAGQAAAWGTTTGVDAGRCSPALLAVEDDDDDFQRQIAAALAASVQSAEEDRRRREVAPRAPLAAGPPVQGPARVPPQQQQQPQGLWTDGGSVCCSGGLVLKPLAAAGRAFGLAGPPPAPLVAAPPIPDASGPPWSRAPHSVPTDARPQAAAFMDGTTADAAAAAVAAAPTPGRRDRSPNLLGPTPACSPCSSAADSQEASAGTAAIVVAVAARRPEAAAVTSSGAPGCVGASVLLSSSPAKHARTPSLAGASEAAQPQMKRSRPAADSGVVQLQVPELAGRDAARAAAAVVGEGPMSSQQQQPGPGWRHSGGLGVGLAGAAADRSASGRAAAVLHAASALRLGGGVEKAVLPQSYSPPERPASAASGCTASAGAVAGEDGGCVAATASGLASVDSQHQHQQLLGHPHEEPVLLGLSGNLPPRPGPDRRQWEAAAGCEAGGGGGGGSGGSGSWPLASSVPIAVGDVMAPPLPPLPPLDPQQQLRHRRIKQAVVVRGAAAEGYSGGGQGLAESGSMGSVRYTLDLSSGGHSTRLQQQQQQQQQWPIQQQQQPFHQEPGPPQQHRAQQQRPGPAPAAISGAVPPCDCSSHGATRGSVAPLDLSRPGQPLVLLQSQELLPPQEGSQAASEPPGAFLHWPMGPTERTSAPAVDQTLTCEETASAAADGDDPMVMMMMITDSPAAPPPPPSLYPPSPSGHDFSAATAAAPPVVEAPDGLVSSDVGAADVATGLLGWVYSGTDRRMLLHQRVWWWLGPGLVQVGRISAIDRRSEPLLYSVRLDADVPSEAQTIIATADCLFPYLGHGDKLMCRLPPAVWLETSSSNSSSGDSTSSCSSGDGVGPAGSSSMPQQQQQRRFEEWPEVGGGEAATGCAAAAGAAAAATGACVWMCGTLQHCIFDGRLPMVHVLLGAEGVPYSVPYEFVVPVSDAAEGSGCAAPAGAAAGGPAGCYGPVNYNSCHNNRCTDMVPFGPVA